MFDIELFKYLHDFYFIFNRIMVKEYDPMEIENMPNLDTEKTKVKDEIESISNDLFRSCSAGYSEIYYALLHLKVIK